MLSYKKDRVEIIHSLEIPKFSGPQADLEFEQWARLAMAYETQRKRDRTIQLLASGQVTVSEALALTQVETIETARSHFLKRKREREAKIRLLTRIDGIGVTLAERLINEFGSLEDIAEATPEQLQIVEGIGEKLAKVVAKEIRKVIHLS